MASTGPARRFPRSLRLGTAAEFDAVFRRSRKSADRWFTILYSPNELGQPRLGLAIARRRVRRATARNRLRRLVRESFRHAAASLPAVDLVVMARAEAVEADNAALRESLARHWQRIGARPPVPGE